MIFLLSFVILMIGEMLWKFNYGKDKTTCTFLVLVACLDDLVANKHFPAGLLLTALTARLLGSGVHLADELCLPFWKLISTP